jgi:hypothetical protein
MSTEARAALARLLAIVQHPEAPSIGNLPQVDLASRWYVTLASAVESECAHLTVVAEDA